MSASRKIHKKYQNKPKIASEPAMEGTKNSENMNADQKNTEDNVMNAANGAKELPATEGTQVLDKKGGIEIIGVPTTAEAEEAKKVAKIEDIIIIDKECYELDLNKGRIAKIEKLDELVNVER